MCASTTHGEPMILPEDDDGAWHYQMQLEARQFNEDWQILAAADPEYAKWLEQLEQETANERSTERLDVL